MIIAERKPFNEIKEMVTPFRKIMVVGCGTCVAICWAGGEREVAELASQLRLAFPQGEKEVIEGTIQRQCEKEMVSVPELKGPIESVDVVVSLACGVGVQTVAQLFPDKTILPGLNTTFMGMPEREGLWVEYCIGCGDCLLGRTGGICPNVRCAKGLLNGPCGGTKNDKCEADPEKDCAWVLIYNQLKRQGKLDLIREINTPRDYRAVRRPGVVKAEKA